MQKNSELQQLFSNYKNLSSNQLDRLIALVVKQEKEKLGLTLPVELKIDYDELSQNSAGGDSTLDFDEKTGQYHYTIRLNANEWYKQYLLNRNQTYQNGDMTFESSLDSLYNLIARVCHEMRHAYQNEQTHIKKDLSNSDALVWLKQELVVTNEKFYRESHNYSNMPREVDAFNYQYKEALDYIRNYTNIERDNPKFFTTLQETLNKNKRENVRPLDELTFIVNGKEIKAIEYLNHNMIDAMKTHNITPEIIENSILRYEYNSDFSKKSFEQLMADKQKIIDGLDNTLPNYIHLLKKIESIYDSIINNDSELQRQQENESRKTDENQSGYSIEKNGTSYMEKQQQLLQDEAGNEIGTRTIIWNTDIEKGTENIKTVGRLENSTGEYLMKEFSETLGGELQLHRKELTNQNKNTGEQEKFVYQKDSKGNETYYKTVNGKLTYKIIKNEKGFMIDTFNKGQPLETFEYDENGNVIAGMPGIESIDDDYVVHLFDSQVPYFEAENKALDIQETKTIDTQKLGKETLEEQKDTHAKDTVETDMETQMKANNRTQQSKQEYQEQPETKTHSTENPESFRSKMKFEMTPEMYQEILRRHSEAEKNFERETAENPDRRKAEQTEYRVK